MEKLTMEATMQAKQTWLAFVVVGLIGLVTPAPATSAVTLGETFVPPDSCTANTTYLQTASAGNSYVAPSPGVITSWSFQAPAATVPQGMKFNVAHPEGGNLFTIIAESAAKNPTAGLLNTYTDISFPVQAGDVIGFFSGGPGGVKSCDITASDSGYNIHYETSDVPTGTPFPFTTASGFHIDVSATLESDCDGDGLGDESEDGDLSSCDASAPLATITKGPSDKTRKASATFEFIGTDVRVVSGFQCKVDAGAFAACTSPYTVRVKKGKHTFQVQAVDQAGNVGPPATDTWKRKKKRKKKR